MTIAHSPAPWHDCGPGSAGRGRMMLSAANKSIAVLYSYSINPHADADARLIAAAPELLAAVRALLAWCEKINDGEDGDDYLNGIIATAAAVLAGIDGSGAEGS